MRLKKLYLCIVAMLLCIPTMLAQQGPNAIYVHTFASGGATTPVEPNTAEDPQLTYNPSTGCYEGEILDWPKMAGSSYNARVFYSVENDVVTYYGGTTGSMQMMAGNGPTWSFNITATDTPINRNWFVNYSSFNPLSAKVSLNLDQAKITFTQFENAGGIVVPELVSVTPANNAILTPKDDGSVDVVLTFSGPVKSMEVLVDEFEPEPTANGDKTVWTINIPANEVDATVKETQGKLTVTVQRIMAENGFQVMTGGELNQYGVLKLQYVISTLTNTATFNFTGNAEGLETLLVFKSPEFTKPKDEVVDGEPSYNPGDRIKITDNKLEVAYNKGTDVTYRFVLAPEYEMEISSTVDYNEGDNWGYLYGTDDDGDYYLEVTLYDGADGAVFTCEVIADTPSESGEFMSYFDAKDQGCVQINPSQDGYILITFDETVNIEQPYMTFYTYAASAYGADVAVKAISSDGKFLGEESTYQYGPFNRYSNVNKVVFPVTGGQEYCVFYAPAPGKVEFFTNEPVLGPAQDPTYEVTFAFLGDEEAIELGEFVYDNIEETLPIEDGEVKVTLVDRSNQKFIFTLPEGYQVDVTTESPVDKNDWNVTSVTSDGKLITTITISSAMDGNVVNITVSDPRPTTMFTFWPQGNQIGVSELKIYDQEGEEILPNFSNNTRYTITFKGYEATYKVVAPAGFKINTPISGMSAIPEGALSVTQEPGENGTTNYLITVTNEISANATGTVGNQIVLVVERLETPQPAERPKELYVASWTGAIEWGTPVNPDEPEAVLSYNAATGCYEGKIYNWARKASALDNNYVQKIIYSVEADGSILYYGINSNPISPQTLSLGTAAPFPVRTYTYFVSNSSEIAGYAISNGNNNTPLSNVLVTLDWNAHNVSFQKFEESTITLQFTGIEDAYKKVIVSDMVSEDGEMIDVTAPVLDLSFLEVGSWLIGVDPQYTLTISCPELEEGDDTYRISTDQIMEGMYYVNSLTAFPGANGYTFTVNVEEAAVSGHLYFGNVTMTLEKGNEDPVTKAVAVSLETTNEFEYKGFQFDITLPAGVALDKTNAIVNPEYEGASVRIAGPYDVEDGFDENTYGVLVYMSQPSNLVDNLVTLTFSTAYGEIEAGTYYPEILNTVIFSTTDGDEIEGIEGFTGILNINIEKVPVESAEIKDVEVAAPSISNDPTNITEGESLNLTVEITPEDADVNPADFVWTVEPEDLELSFDYDEEEGVWTVDTSKANVTEETDVTITVTVGQDEEGNDVQASYTFTLKPVLLGDSNANGRVNVADVVTTANYIAELPVVEFCWPNANVILNDDEAEYNRNGITIADVTATVQISMNNWDEERNPQNVRRYTSRSISNDRLISDNFKVTLNKPFNVGVNLDNSIPYSAISATVNVPEGMTVHEVTVGPRAINHELVYNITDDGRVNVVIFSILNTPFHEVEGSLFNLVVTAQEDCGNVIIDRISASDASSNIYDLGFEGGLNQSVATGIDGLDAEEEGDVRYYDINGVEVVNPEAGQILIRVANGNAVKVVK